jgi:hypothetical protein
MINDIVNSLIFKAIRYGSMLSPVSMPGRGRADLDFFAIQARHMLLQTSDDSSEAMWPRGCRHAPCPAGARKCPFWI